MSELSRQCEALQQVFRQDQEALIQDPSPKGLEDLRIKWMGRKGELSSLYQELRGVAKDERPAAGKAINELKLAVEGGFSKLKGKVDDLMVEKKLAKKLDITLPVGDLLPSGGVHPVALMRETLLRIFRSYGFVVYDGPELESDFFNFTALNIPENHPARDMQDTFFVDRSDDLVLRTHTSNIQIHVMQNLRPPVRFVAPGRVFRVDNDATHTPMFHQIESVAVDRGISFAHLKGIVSAFLREVFGSDVKTRFRPSFFPFVEPGAEADVACTICRGRGCRVCSHTGWLEVGGCGMIHPNVFEAVGYDSETYTGFAFGFGIDRMAMLAYGLSDLRQLFEGDSSFQEQFPIFVTERN